MQEIATAIQEGAMAYLKRQFKTIIVILDPARGRRVPHVDGGEEGRAARRRAVVRGVGRRPHAARSSPAAFLSGLTGFIGMSLAVRGNVRTAAAARTARCRRR